MQVSELRPGENVKTLKGLTRVVSFTMTNRVEPAYNIEVANDHCYRVGECGVLVHNQSASITAGMYYGCDNVAGKGDIGRGEINSNIAGGVPADYQGHHLIGVVEAGQSAAVKRAVLVGYNVNGRNNGIALPS